MAKGRSNDVNATTVRPMEVIAMLCPSCCEQTMTIVDGTGEGDPCWVCPGCHYVMDYDRADEEPSCDGKDDGAFLQKRGA